MKEKALQFWKDWGRPLYFSNRLYGALAGLCALFVISFFYPVLLFPAKMLFLLLIAFTLGDTVLLFSRRQGVQARREMHEKFSNGDENEVVIQVENRFSFALHCNIIEEAPIQFQLRDFTRHLHVPASSRRKWRYVLRPVKRGEYHFGVVNVYASTRLGLVRRRFEEAGGQMIKVYPSFLQMRKYELLAVSNRLQDTGLKRRRRLGLSSEFEQIREYVEGDEPRTVNWKATARKGSLMVNHYQEEKAQQVVCIIDKGRVMRMPFAGMSLLDYSINAALVLSNIALIKGDKAGIATFAETLGAYIAPERRNHQLHRILELLYNQKTRYLESNHEALFLHLRKNLPRRSLLLFFTNFETLYGLERQLPFFKALARTHLLVVIFFENTELNELLSQKSANLEEIYVKTLAEKLSYDKRLISKELERHGILSVVSSPAGLTVNTLNKYLELKSRGLI